MAKKKKFNPREYTEMILKANPGLFYSGERYPRGHLLGYSKKNKIWRDMEGDIRRYLREKLLPDDFLYSDCVNEIVKDLVELTYQFERPTEPHWRYINLKSGIWDIQEQKFVSSKNEADFFFLQQLPIKLNTKNKDCGFIDKLFSQWVGDRKIILYELIAYCLIRAYPYQKLFIIHGPGNNGKSSYIEILRKFLGNKNISSVSLGQILTDRFAPSKLVGRLANLSGEIGTGILQKTDVVKQLVGQDTIYVQEKFKKGFDYQNYGKMVFNTNTIPPTSDKTPAFYRRFYPILFPNTFENENNDPFLFEKVTSEELEGLLFIALNKILPDLIDRKFKFTIDLSTDELERQYEDLSNPLIAFIRERCVEDEDSYIPKPVFTREFNKFCSGQGLKKFSDREIGQIMYRENYVAKQKTLKEEEIKKWHLPKVSRVWEGLKLKIH